MPASPQSIPDDLPHDPSDIRASVPHLKTSSGLQNQRVERRFQNPPSTKGQPILRVSQSFPSSKERIARKLQRIDMLLNLVYSRVANDRSLKVLLPYILEHEARDLVSNFAYVRHQQDTQEFKSEMTDKQVYRIFRHHYRAEQRLADTVRKLRRSSAKTDSQNLSEITEESASVENPSQLIHAVNDLENDTAAMRVRRLEEVEGQLKEMSYMHQAEDDLLYIQEFSQSQQISTMQARCMTMKDEYEADDMRKGRFAWTASETKKKPKKSISGPEDWEDDPSQPRVPASSVARFGVLSGEWTPPDPPRSPSPSQHRSHKVTGKYVEPEDVVDGGGEAYAEDNLSLPLANEYRQGRPQRQTSHDREKRIERRDNGTFRNPESREKQAHLSGFSERRDRRGSSSQRSFSVTNTKRKNGSHNEDLRSSQRRYSRHHPPLPNHSQSRRHRLEGHTSRTDTKRPGRSPRTSRAHLNAKSSTQAANHASAGENRYHHTNAEYATMPSLHRTSLGSHKETFYDDAYGPPRGGSGQSQDVGGHSLDPFQRPFPHESADAFGWKPPEGSMGGQYRPGSAAPKQPVAAYPQPGDPYVNPSFAEPSVPQGSGYTYDVGGQAPVVNPNFAEPSMPQGSGHTYDVGGQAPAGTENRKRDEWRYSNGLSSGLLDSSKDSLGVMYSIANKVTGRKAHAHIPHTPIQVMQAARKDPVKFMTKMVVGEVMPQTKRKAHKLESILTNDSMVGGFVAGQVGSMLTKKAKESMGHGGSSKTGGAGQVGQMLTKMATQHGGSSKTGVSGQVGQMLAKMTLDSAVGGGSSKANVTSQVGKVLAKVAKDSMK